MSLVELGASMPVRNHMRVFLSLDIVIVAFVLAPTSGEVRSNNAKHNFKGVSVSSRK